MAMTPYVYWYGGLGGYAVKSPTGTIIEYKPHITVPKGWADWYKAAYEGAW